MKRLFLLLVLLPTIVLSQTSVATSHLLGPLPAYRGQTANLKIPFLQVLSADADSTIDGVAGFENKKYPLIIAHHGIGERTDQYSTMSSVSTGDLGSLYNTSLPSLVRYTTSVLYNKRYRIPGTSDSISFCYLFPQVYEGHGYTYPAYTYYMIKYAKDNLSHIIDTNRIYLAGLSLGGGGVFYALQDTMILEQLAAAAANCAGYINPSIGGLPFNLRATSRWGGGVLIGHSTNDSVTDKHPTTRVGSYYSDRFVDSLNKWKGITTVIYRRHITGGHTPYWDRMYHPNNANRTDYPQSNGQNGNWSVGMHNYFLMFTNKGRRKTTTYWNHY